MSKAVLARISRISFHLDMTRANAPVVPLGFILEAAWDKRARWMGLIGRTRLNDHELGQVNLNTWPDLRTPFSLLDGMFEKGWEADWGNSGAAIGGAWRNSPILIDTADKALGDQFRANTKKHWVETDRLLVLELYALAPALKPLMPVTTKPATIIQFPKRPVAVPSVREIKQVENRELEKAAA